MIFDTHCHYNLDPLFSSWESYWQKAQENNVKKSVVVGTSVETSQCAVKIAGAQENLWASVAIHPIEFNEVGETPSENLIENLKTELQTLLSAENKIVAVGETGLDYFHLNQEKTLSEETKQKIVELQKSSLKMHIELAQQYNLPLILHVRDQSEHAYWDTLELLETAHYTGKFVLHCVSGPTAYVQKALEMGGYIGSAGNVTYKNAEHIRELIRFAPQDRVLLETDAPFLPPQNFRGQTCEPWMISQTAEFLQQELGISEETTWQNAHTFFSLE